MVQSTKIQIMRPSSNTLLSMCIKCVAKNIKLYENDECFLRLPKHLKVKIARFITRCLQEMDLGSFQILLNDQVTSLNLVSFEINDDLLLAISTKCSKLNSLYIRGNTKYLSMKGLLEISKLKYLERLEVLNSKIIDDEFIESITNSCLMLYHLSIPGSQITDKCFHSLEKTKIRNLNVSNTKISDEFVENLSMSDLAKNLEELSVSYNKVTSKGLSLLPWKNLKYVAFQGCDIDETLFDISAINILGTLEEAIRGESA